MSPTTRPRRWRWLTRLSSCAPGESSNPLFRGFGNQSKEEIERYDQPVMVRLGKQDIDLGAGANDYRVEDTYRLPVAA